MVRNEPLNFHPMRRRWIDTESNGTWKVGAVACDTFTTQLKIISLLPATTLKWSCQFTSQNNCTLNIHPVLELSGISSVRRRSPFESDQSFTVPSADPVVRISSRASKSRDKTAAVWPVKHRSWSPVLTSQDVAVRQYEAVKSKQSSNFMADTDWDGKIERHSPVLQHQMRTVRSSAPEIRYKHWTPCSTIISYYYFRLSFFFNQGRGVQSPSVSIMEVLVQHLAHAKAEMIWY